MLSLLRFNSQVPTQEERKENMNMMMEKLINMGSPADDQVFCHNDSNPTNIIYDEENGKRKGFLAEFK